MKWRLSLFVGRELSPARGGDGSPAWSRFRLMFLLLLPFLLCLSSGLALAQGTGDVLRFIVTNDNSSGNHFCYWRFSTVAYTRQAGDCIEYDVYLNAAMDGLGGIEVYSSGHPSGWRDQPDWYDLEGDHGTFCDLSNKAFYRWHHRTIPVPAAITVGESINKWNVVWECDTPSTGMTITGTAYYDNVVITNNGVVKKVIYQTGNPNKNVLEFENGIASRSFGRYTNTPGDSDIMRFSTTTLRSPGPESHIYYRFSNASRTVQAGDCIEYDVYLANNLAQLGGIEVFSNNHPWPGGWRDLGLVDQNGRGLAPYADISDLATYKWYHRVFILPEGDTITAWDVAAEYDAAATTATAYYDNIVITRNGVVQGTPIYKSGQPPVNSLDFEYNFTYDYSYELSAGPARKSDSFIGTHFFFWHDRPNDWGLNCITYEPPGWRYPYSGTNEWYSMKNQGWYQREIADMKLAGIDYLFPVSYAVGFNNNLENLVNAIRDTGSDLKIAMFVDGFDFMEEWRIELCNPPNACDTCYIANNNKLPLNSAQQHRWTDTIIPFFDLVPPEMWATHNGLPVGQGGRPLIVAYGFAYYDGTTADYADQLWSYVKQTLTDYFTSRGFTGLQPWLVVDHSWWASQSTQAEQDQLFAVEDGEVEWGNALNGPQSSPIDVRGYISSEIGPGFDSTPYEACLNDCAGNPDPGPGRYRQPDNRWDAEYWTLDKDYNKMSESDLMVIETWNELWEGSGIFKAVQDGDTDPLTFDYPAPGGGYLPGDYYIQELRNLRWTKPGVPEWDETFLDHSLPVPLQANSPVSFTVKNDGMNKWPHEDIQLIGRLLDPANESQIKIAYLAKSPWDVYHGEAVLFDDTLPGGCRIPSDWTTTGNYILEVYPAVNGANIYPAGSTTAPAGFGHGRLRRLVAIAPIGTGVSGTVTCNSQPLQYASIEAFRISDNVKVGRATTDANGNYTMGLAPGTNAYRIECRKYGLLPWPFVITPITVISSNWTTVNFTLTGGVVGRVRGPISGVPSLPLPNATIKAFQGSTEIGQTTTDADGMYYLALAAGTYRIECSKSGYLPFPSIRDNVSVPVDAVVGIDFYLTQ